MSDNRPFDPLKISIIEYKMIKGQVDAPEEFSIEWIKLFDSDANYTLGFNFDGNFVKADINIEISTNSEGRNKSEAIGKFHFSYIYHIENLSELVTLNEDKSIQVVNFELGAALASLTYSTSRGVLLIRLQGTPFQSFILPVIDVKQLL